MATPLAFAKTLLKRLGLPQSENRLVGLVAFAGIEGGHWHNKAAYNPFNTTLHMPGSYPAPGTIVQAYTSWSSGIEATARTMVQGNMHTIMDALKADAAPRAFLQAITQSKWCPGCDYTPFDPYALYKTHANEEDASTTALATTTGTNWVLILGLAAILGLLGGVLWYFYTGHVPLARTLGFARENPSSKRRGKGRSKVQTLIFPRQRFSTSSAKAWARRNGFKSGKVDVTDRSIRIRQRAPSGFRRMRTISMGPDVKAVVGFQ